MCIYLINIYFYFLGRFHIQFYEDGHSDKLKGTILYFNVLIYKKLVLLYDLVYNNFDYMLISMLFSIFYFSVKGTF